MIKALNPMRIKGGKEKSKADYIARLQGKGVLKQYFTAKGYVAYDTNEYKEYKKNARVGRPARKVGEQVCN